MNEYARMWAEIRERSTDVSASALPTIEDMEARVRVLEAAAVVLEARLGLARQMLRLAREASPPVPMVDP